MTRRPRALALLLLAAASACGGSGSDTAPASVMVVGDSITFGSAPAIEAAFADAGVEVDIDAAIGRRIVVGDGVKQPLNGVDTVLGLLARGVRADTWVIALATNDVGQYDATSEATVVQQLLDLVPAEATLVWVDTCLPDRRPESDRINTTIANLVGARDRASVATWSTVCADPGLLLSDQVHPTDAGEEAFAQVIADAVLP